MLPALSSARAAAQTQPSGMLLASASNWWPPQNIASPEITGGSDQIAGSAGSTV